MKKLTSTGKTITASTFKCLYCLIPIFTDLSVLINVYQAICDAHCRFLSVSATKPGSCHDSTIFKESIIGQKFQDGVFDEAHLLGDSGYPCTSYLLTPFAHPEGQCEMRFNAAHKSTRCTIERAFGILKRRFYCLQLVLRVSPDKASR